MLNLLYYASRINEISCDRNKQFPVCYITSDATTSTSAFTRYSSFLCLRIHRYNPKQRSAEKNIVHFLTDAFKKCAVLAMHTEKAEKPSSNVGGSTGKDHAAEISAYVFPFSRISMIYCFADFHSTILFPLIQSELCMEQRSYCTLTFFWIKVYNKRKEGAICFLLNEIKICREE